MKRVTQRECLLFVVLVGLGAGLRLAFQDLPNFAPIAAISLFAGYYFRRTRIAAAIPVLVMLISDYFIGAYSWYMMLVVYGMLALPALCGPQLRRQLRFDGPSASLWRPLAALLTCSLGASLLFFVVTNFGSWLWFDSYTKSWSGLISCYTAAIPFFRYTLAGDLIFGAVLFGSYAAVTRLASLTSESPESAPSVG